VWADRGGDALLVVAPHLETGILDNLGWLPERDWDGSRAERIARNDAAYRPELPAVPVGIEL
jgi:hypothetical protein